jgi:hypothetical protein
VSAPERHLARIVGFDLWFDRGWQLPLMSGHFEYEGGGHQGIGYIVDTEFVGKLCEAVGVDTLKALSGKSCWVTHTRDRILKVEPLHAKDGTPFNVDTDWTTRLKALAEEARKDEKSEHTHDDSCPAWERWPDGAPT